MTTENGSTGETQTTNGTGTGTNGSGTESDQGTNNGGLAAALGDGTGGEKSAAEAGATGGDASGASDKPSPGAPESYAAFTAPEGYELDAKLIGEAAPIFKELGLSQEQAQKLVDFYGKSTVASNKAVMDAWAEQRTAWREEMKSDATLGKLLGKDGNFGPDSPLVSTVNRALTGLQNPKLVSDFKAAMDMTGAGDNPAFVRVLYALASKVTEGTTHAAGGPPGQGNSSRPRTAAAAVYPNLPSAGA